MNFRYLVIYIILALTTHSCVEFHRTKKGGFRIEDPTVFEYNSKKHFKKIDFSKIDTNSIYILDSLINPYDSVKYKNISGRFCRFFPKGQVLFASYDSIISDDLINDKEIGIPGYFTMEGNKVKIDMFQNLNGGQTGKYFGKLMDNGDIMFYQQRPETYNESYKGLEKYGKKTFWKKTKIDSIKFYYPEW